MLKARYNLSKAMKISGIALISIVALTGCSATLQDRSDGLGSEPDTVSDTTDVTVYRNADDVPNVAYFCAGDYGWASTMNTSTGRGELHRFEEYDSICSDK